MTSLPLTPLHSTKKSLALDKNIRRLSYFRFRRAKFAVVASGVRHSSKFSYFLFTLFWISLPRRATPPHSPSPPPFAPLLPAIAKILHFRPFAQQEVQRRYYVTIYYPQNWPPTLQNRKFLYSKFSTTLLSKLTPLPPFESYPLHWPLNNASQVTVSWFSKTTWAAEKSIKTLCVVLCSSAPHCEFWQFEAFFE